MPLEYLIFDPSAFGFPKPRVPPLPDTLACLSLSAQASAIWSPASNIRHFTRGRYALREAYRLAGIGPGSALLAPAYHCRTMLDPALALGGEVLFIRSSRISRPIWRHSPKACLSSRPRR
ncbi:MAG: hypothetical protein IPK39_23725 [Sulfuritalea sp.]|nr:hypothetical protein [Sulfuritalea sp.]